MYRGDWARDRADSGGSCDAKSSKRDAKHQVEKEIHLWHCRDCAEHGCGCCGKGDISFNEVGGAGWATKRDE